MPSQEPTLETIAQIVLSDPGLRANIPMREIEGGADGARLMNQVIAEAIAATGVNEDGQITPDDARAISDYIRANADLYDRFIEGHGDDEGNTETGYHLVQGDGGTLIFQGRNFVNTIADAIYHIGFEYENGRFLNEDGNANEEVDDIAGWLNYFVNGVNAVFGTDGSDTLSTGTYSDALDDAEDETFLAADGNDTVWAGDGDDTVHGGSGNDSAGGGDGDDVLLGQAGHDSLWGGDGDDSLNGGAGNDEIGGGEGADTLNGGGGNDTLNGGLDKDKLVGRNGNDHLWGDDGDDRLLGGSGRDDIGGGDGDDVMRGGADDDTLHGGDGDDRARGGSGDDNLGGGTGDDTLGGNSGHDSLWGGDGDDRMYGGAGHDDIGGGNGHDTLLGGSGNDSFWGGDGNDVLRGDKGRDEMGGGNGDDLIVGNGGADALNGHDGADTLLGGAGDDTLAGGSGQDVFDGGSGADLLRGWEGRASHDVFVFDLGDSGLTAGTRDVIEGFDEGQDKIDLSSFSSLSFVGDASFSGTGAEVRFDGSLLEIDADGDGAADMAIEVKYASDLDAGDLILA